MAPMNEDILAVSPLSTVACCFKTPCKDIKAETLH